MENQIKEKIYIIGIEGAGTSALARMYADLGHEVMGSDNGDHFYADVLKEKNILVYSRYQAKNLPQNLTKVIYSTSIKKNNPEYQEAEKRKVKLLSYPEALAELFNQKIGLAICGTHGKTTTSALIAHILKESGKDPQAIIGSKVINWKANSLTGQGEYFVIEADEYQNKLRYYNPYAIVLTSLDWDHPDFYSSFKDYQQVFQGFISKIPKIGWLIYNNDDANVIKVAEKANRKISYGFHPESDYQITQRKNFLKLKEKKWGEFFTLKYKEKIWGNFQINLLGKHNVSNASAAIVLANQIGINLIDIQRALKTFQGTVRRFEFVGEIKGALLIDDYAHHPEEIKATLQAARELFPQRMIRVIFHPHSFTRTEALLEEFAQSFNEADEVKILTIYGSAREEKGNVSAQDLVKAINRYQAGLAEYLPSLKSVTQFIQTTADNNQVILTLGAGDIWKAGREAFKEASV